MNNAQLLPPKMLAQYAARAAKGDYEYKLQGDIYIWFVGQQEITVIGLASPTGTCKKLTQRELENERANLAVYKKEITREEDRKS